MLNVCKNEKIQEKQNLSLNQEFSCHIIWVRFCFLAHEIQNIC